MIFVLMLHMIKTQIFIIAQKEDIIVTSQWFYSGNMIFLKINSLML